MVELCVFQGTFNPIHRAHLDMAEFVLQNYNVGKILFIPASVPPHKKYDIQMAQHRLNMVKLATAYNPQFEVSDIEFQREGKSYSYLTALELYKIYNVGNKIKFIIGTDAFEKIETWYMSDEFKKMVDFIVFVRDNNFNLDNFQYLKEKGYSFHITQKPFKDISSTELREKIKQGKPVNDIVTQEVEEYIQANELYK